MGKVLTLSAIISALLASGFALFALFALLVASTMRHWSPAPSSSSRLLTLYPRPAGQ